MNWKLLFALIVLVFSSAQILRGLPGWDSIYHGAMTRWVAENGITGWVDTYQEQYSYPPGLHLLGSFFLDSGLNPSFISYFIGCIFLALTVLSMRKGWWAFALSRPSYNLLFAGFIPTSISLFFFSVICNFRKLVPIFTAALILFSPNSAIPLAVTAIFMKEIRRGFIIGILLTAPWLITTYNDFSKFSVQISTKLSDLPELLGTSFLILVAGLLSKNRWPTLTLFLLSFNPLPGQWDRMIYFSFILALEEFDFKLLAPILILSLQLAPIVFQDWGLLYWAHENLVSKVLADPALRPALLSVSNLQVLHGKDWRNETEYQKYINCDDLTGFNLKNVIMKDPCPYFKRFSQAYDKGYHAIVTTIG